MKPPEDKSWDRKLAMATAGIALGYAGIVLGIDNQDKIAATETRDACVALISTVNSMNTDETQRRELCTNKLIDSCLAKTDICKK